MYVQYIHTVPYVLQVVSFGSGLGTVCMLCYTRWRKRKKLLTVPTEPGRLPLLFRFSNLPYISPLLEIFFHLACALHRYMCVCDVLNRLLFSRPRMLVLKLL